MKMKKIGALISALLCVSLVSVGFASWIITGDATATTEAGTIVTDSIVDHSVTMSMAFGEGPANDAKIIFGKPADLGSPTYNWLTPTDKVEDLSAKLTLTFDDSKGGIIPTKENINVELKTTDSTASNYYQKAIDGNVITEKPTITVGNVEGKKCEITVTFAWGTAFKSQNPYFYYNNQALTPEIKADALAKMKLVENLKNVKYTLTVTAKAK